jgi:hypothetical protein
MRFPVVAFGLLVYAQWREEARAICLEPDGTEAGVPSVGEGPWPMGLRPRGSIEEHQLVLHAQLLQERRRLLGVVNEDADSDGQPRRLGGVTTVEYVARATEVADLGPEMLNQVVSRLPSHARAKLASRSDTGPAAPP